MIVQTDSRRRITIPSDLGIKPGDTLELEVLSDGRMMLIPVVTVPKHQLWAWEKDTLNTIQESLKDSRPSTIIETSKELKKITKRWNHED